MIRSFVFIPALSAGDSGKTRRTLIPFKFFPVSGSRASAGDLLKEVPSQPFSIFGLLTASSIHLPGTANKGRIFQGSLPALHCSTDSGVSGNRNEPSLMTGLAQAEAKNNRARRRRPRVFLLSLDGRNVPAWERGLG